MKSVLRWRRPKQRISASRRPAKSSQLWLFENRLEVGGGHFKSGYVSVTT